jgi:hypothetical protein
MRRHKSDIPADAKEEMIGSYSEEQRHSSGGVFHPEVRAYRIARKIVGYRYYNADGVLINETPMKDGKKHGHELTWDDDGTLLSVEPYWDGKCHGTAKQYGRDGRVIGTYKMVHGTGYDLWRNMSFHGPSYYVCEIHSVRNGLLHGFVWWLNDDEKSVWDEKHWYEGKSHGINREWNFAGKLRRGYPKYWVRDEAVTKRQYVAAARKDATLPPFRPKDNSPKREFPPEIRRLLKDSKKR